MSNPEVHYGDSCLATDAPELGGLLQKFVGICNDDALAKYKRNFIPNPSDVEITPVIINDDDKIVLRAWHQTSGPMPGVFQHHVLGLGVKIIEEDAFLVSETGANYVLTTRETLVLNILGTHALMHAVTDSGPRG